MSNVVVCINKQRVQVNCLMSVGDVDVDMSLASVDLNLTQL